MPMTLQNIEITGAPTSSDLATLPVRLTYADNPDLDAAGEFLQFEINSPAGYGRSMGEVEIYALTLISNFIRLRIEELNTLKGRR